MDRIRYHCRECSLSFDSASALAKHKEKFCVGTRFSDPEKLSRDLEKERIGDRLVEDGLPSYREVSSYIRNRDESDVGGVGDSSLGSLRRWFQYNDDMKEEMRRELEQDLRKDRLDDVRKMKVRQQQQKAQQKEQEQRLMEIVDEMENRKERELEVKLAAERARREMKMLDNSSLQSIQQSKRQELEVLRNELEGMRKREESAMNELQRLEGKMLEKEEERRKDDMQLKQIIDKEKKEGKLDTFNTRQNEILEERAKREAVRMAQTEQLQQERESILSKLENIQETRGDQMNKEIGGDRIEESDSLDNFIDKLRLKQTSDEANIRKLRLEHEKALEMDKRAVSEAMIIGEKNGESSDVTNVGEYVQQLDARIEDKYGKIMGDMDAVRIEGLQIMDSMLERDSLDAIIAKKGQKKVLPSSRQSTPSDQKVIEPNNKQEFQEEIDEVEKPEEREIRQEDSVIIQKNAKRSQSIGGEDLKTVQRPPHRGESIDASLTEQQQLDAEKYSQMLGNPLMTQIHRQLIATQDVLQKHGRENERLEREVEKMLEKKEDRRRKRTQEELNLRIEKLSRKVSGKESDPPEDVSSRTEKSYPEMLSEQGDISDDEEIRLRKIEREHRGRMVTMKYEMERLKQENELRKLKRELEEQESLEKKKAEHQQWVEDQKRALIEAKLKKKLAVEQPAGLPGIKSGTEYSAEKGFAIFWDFLLGLPKRVAQIQVAYAFFDFQVQKSSVRSLPESDCDHDGVSHQRCILATKRHFVKIAPVPNLKCIIEVQQVLHQSTGPESQSKTQSLGWTILELFDKKGRLNSGFWRLLIFWPPVASYMNTETIASNAKPVPHTEIFLRIIDADGITAHSQAGINPDAVFTRYVYPLPFADNVRKGVDERSAVPSQTQQHEGTINRNNERTEPERDGTSLKVDESKPSDVMERETLEQESERKHKRAQEPVDEKKEEEETEEKEKEDEPKEDPDEEDEKEEDEKSEEEEEEEEEDSGEVFTERSVLDVNVDVLKGVGSIFVGDSVIVELSICVDEEEGCGENGKKWAAETIEKEVTSEDDVVQIDEKFSFRDVVERAKDEMKEEAKNIVILLVKLVLVKAPILEDDKPEKDVVGWCALPLFEDSITPREGSVQPCLGTHQLQVYSPPVRISEVKKDSRRRNISNLCDEGFAIITINSRTEKKAVDIRDMGRSGWFPHGKTFVPNEIRASKKAYKPGDGIDLYIDGCRFLPFNVTISAISMKMITRVSGATGEEYSGPCRLRSSCASPFFDLKCELRERNYEATSTLLFRVDTLESESIEKRVVGYGVLNLFVNPEVEKKGERLTTHSQPIGRISPGYSLNVGNFQLPIRRDGLRTVGRASASSLDDNEKVPCASLLVRIKEAPKDESGRYLSVKNTPKRSWREKKVWIPSPNYANGGYDTSRISLAPYEEKILRERISESQTSVDDTFSKVVDVEGEKTIDEKEDFVLEVLTPKPREVLLPISRGFWCRYEPSVGFHVSIERCMNLPKNGIVKCIYTLCPPGSYFETEKDPSAAFFTLQNVLESTSKNPEWNDGFRTFRHIRPDKNLCLIVAVVVARKMAIPMPLETIGFSVLPLLSPIPSSESTSSHCIRTGYHQIPLFSGLPPQEMLADIKAGVETISDIVPRYASERRLKFLVPSSVIVRVEDAKLGDEIQLPSDDYVTHYVTKMFIPKFQKMGKGGKKQISYAHKGKDAFMDDVNKEFSSITGIAITNPTNHRDPSKPSSAQ